MNHISDILNFVYLKEVDSSLKEIKLKWAKGNKRNTVEMI